MEDIKVIDLSMDDREFRNYVNTMLRKHGYVRFYMDDGNLVYITLTRIDKLNKYNKIKNKISGKTGIIYLDSGDYVELKDNKAVAPKEEAKETNIQEQNKEEN